MYLNEQLRKHELELEISTLWKMNAHRDPILTFLACDVLAMSISTVAYEFVFSVGGCHLDPFRSSNVLILFSVSS